MSKTIEKIMDEVMTSHLDSMNTMIEKAKELVAERLRNNRCDCLDRFTGEYEVREHTFKMTKTLIPTKEQIESKETLLQPEEQFVIAVCPRCGNTRMYAVEAVLPNFRNDCLTIIVDIFKQALNNEDTREEMEELLDNPYAMSQFETLLGDRVKEIYKGVGK